MYRVISYPLMTIWSFCTQQLSHLLETAYLKIRCDIFVLSAVLLIQAFVVSDSLAKTKTYRWTGLCDASALVRINKETFVVANDENNVLQACDPKSKIQCEAMLDLNKFLGTSPENDHHEADLEGAARIEDRIYWIGSHGRNKDGKYRSNRYQLFATKIDAQGDEVSLATIGEPYTKLARDIGKSKKFASLKLAASIKFTDESKMSKLAPKRKGFNIEGLAGTPNDELLIGLRNPLAHGDSGEAILLSITNPEAVVMDNKKPEFTDPILLNLGNRGIRGIERWPGTSHYLILAGAINNEVTSALYSWDSSSKDEPNLLHEFTGLNPEGLTIQAGKNRIFIASDDGSVNVGEFKDKNDEDQDECKDLPDSNEMHFRVIRLDVDPPSD